MNHMGEPVGACSACRWGIVRAHPKRGTREGVHCALAISIAAVQKGYPKGAARNGVGLDGRGCVRWENRQGDACVITSKDKARETALGVCKWNIHSVPVGFQSAIGFAQ